MPNTVKLPCPPFFNGGFAGFLAERLVVVVVVFAVAKEVGGLSEGPFGKRAAGNEGSTPPSGITQPLRS